MKDVFNSKVYLGAMTWDEVRDLTRKKGAIAIVPLNSTEEHGLHLPLDNDTMQGFILDVIAAEEASKKIPVVVTPPLFYGSCYWTDSFPGTISIKPLTLMQVVEDICESLQKSGFKKILLHPYHGQGGIIKVANVQLKEKGFFGEVFVLGTWDLIREKIKKMKVSKFGGHACEIETSFALALFPERVKMKRAKGIERFMSNFELLEKGIVSAQRDWKNWLRDCGAVGRPKLATKDKGMSDH